MIARTALDLLSEGNLWGHVKNDQELKTIKKFSTFEVLMIKTVDIASSYNSSTNCLITILEFNYFSTRTVLNHLKVLATAPPSR